jgi:hypothetical protein
MSLDELRATGVISRDDPDDVFELVEIIASGAYGSVYKGKSIVVVVVVVVVVDFFFLLLPPSQASI